MSEKYIEKFDRDSFIDLYLTYNDTSTFFGDLIHWLTFSMSDFTMSTNHIGPSRNLAQRNIPIERKTDNIWGKLYFDKKRSAKLNYVIDAFKMSQLQI